MFYVRHNDAIYRHRLAFMLYAWYVKKLRSIGLKTQKMSVKTVGLQRGNKQKFGRCP